MENNEIKKINTLALSPSLISMLPHRVRQIFKVLEKEGNVVIKGGAVRLAVMSLLEKKGQFKDHVRLAGESHINDIDLNFIVVGSVAAMQNLIIEKYYRLSVEFERAGMFLDAKDIEIIEAKDWNQGIEKIIDHNDLIMNEVAMDYYNGRWQLYYTQRACRHIIDGIGVLNPKPGHILYDAGRVFASPLGVIRLVKFLVTGKANKIYLPKWWLRLYLDYYQKKVTAGQMPPNAPLGFYSLVLLENYFGDKPLMQKKAMVALYDLGFTDMLDPDIYIRQQRQIFAAAGNNFEQTEFTIEEVIGRYFESLRKKEENRQNRQAARNICEHEFQKIDCDRCGRNQCNVESCSKCGKNKASGFLPCTLRMRSGQTEPDGFYEIK